MYALDTNSGLVWGYCAGTWVIIGDAGYDAIKSPAYKKINSDYLDLLLTYDSSDITTEYVMIEYNQMTGEMKVVDEV